MSLRIVLASLMLFSVTAGRVAEAQPTPIAGLTTTHGELRAKAQPDECFSFIGTNFPFSAPPCLFSQPKVNQAYVWAMTKAGRTSGSARRRTRSASPRADSARTRPP